MHSRYGLGIGLGTLLCAVALGGTALAAPMPKAEPFVVTNLSIARVTHSTTQTRRYVNITVYDSGNKSGNWEFPQSNPQLLPAISVTDETTRTPITPPGGIVASQLVSSPDPSVQSGGSATATYAFVIPTPSSSGDNFSIGLVSHPASTNKVFHMMQGNSSTAPVYNRNPPAAAVGQLPEAPWAAALPFLALGVGFMWRRRMQHQSTARP